MKGLTRAAIPVLALLALLGVGAAPAAASPTSPALRALPTYECQFADGRALVTVDVIWHADGDGWDGTVTIYASHGVRVTEDVARPPTDYGPTGWLGNNRTWSWPTHTLGGNAYVTVAAERSGTAGGCSVYSPGFNYSRTWTV